MSSEVSAPLRPTAFGLRIALWYATLFIAGAVAIVLVTYVVTASSLAQRDRQIINAKLGEYAAAYSRGGLDLLADTVRAEQQTAPERLFVRVVDRGSVAVVSNMASGWDPSKLETGSIRLWDGTLVEVGKSTDAREELLARFRAALGMVTLAIVLVALGGGVLVTRSAIVPIRRLTQTVERIIQTGRTDARVPVAGTAGAGRPGGAGTGDAIDELTGVFNIMLDRIEGLVTAMRGSLDNVSHDLRTPLTRLRGTAEMALAGPSDPERYREALADCVEETDRVLVMLTTLMDISEAESGAMQLHREKVRLADVVSRAADLYRDVAEAKGVVLQVHLPSGPDGSGTTGRDADNVVVSADRARLEQVAANLIDNAVKYTPARGRVDVEVRPEGDRAALIVRDTGIGIRADELPRIWERLYRGDARGTERGLGLGLSLVRAVVAAHGGTVDVESEPGKGSAFSVHLSRL